MAAGATVIERAIIESAPSIAVAPTAALFFRAQYGK
jgi:hypothetical protein